jgi:hypothetical protein
MTTKQETIQLLEELYDAKEITLTGYYAMRSALSQLMLNCEKEKVKPLIYDSRKDQASYSLSEQRNEKP